MIKCIIVEDESLAQDVLKSHLQKAGRFELVAVCNNAMEAKIVLDTIINRVETMRFVSLLMNLIIFIKDEEKAR